MTLISFSLGRAFIRRGRLLEEIRFLDYVCKTARIYHDKEELCLSLERAFLKNLLPFDFCLLVVL